MPTIKQRERCARCHRRFILSRLIPVTFSEYFRITSRWSFRLHYVCRDQAECEAFKAKKLQDHRAEMSDMIAAAVVS